MSTPSRWPLTADGVRFVAPGFSRELLAVNPLTKGCFPLAIGYYPSAQGHAMHRDLHDDHLLIYCVDGAGRVSTAGLQSSVVAGDLIVLPKGIPHYYAADAAQPWSLYWCHFDGIVSDDFVSQLGELDAAHVLSLGHSSTIIASFKSMLAVRQTGYNSNALILAANQLRQLLAQLPLEIQAYGAPHTHGINVDKIQALMWESIAEFLTLEILAKSANLSKFHFSSAYKKLTGFSPIKHFTHLKMEHACFLLDSTEMSVSEVASELGYDDALYFSRVFKKTLGLSPKHYRTSH